MHTYVWVTKERIETHLLLLCHSYDIGDFVLEFEEIKAMEEAVNVRYTELLNSLIDVEAELHVN